ncbi:MAG: hypothetical protein QOI76_3315, partial [Frankiales bacterium]|nr:hypothetical protein [Frankiales bacterium]
MKSGMRRVTARLATAALAGTFALSGATAAQAWTLGPQIGTATVSPATGIDENTLTIATAGPCTDATATNAQLIMYGQGLPADGYNVSANNPISILPTNPSGGYDVPMLDNLKALAQLVTPPVTYSGTYTIALVCKKAFGFTDYGDYITSITFSNPTHYSSGLPVVPTATTTTLTASPVVVTPGTPVTLSAAVTPAGATGSVQFLDAAVPLGAATLNGSSAALTVPGLSAGTHALTAVFTPTGPAGALPSTSTSVAYQVLAASTELTIPVGTVLRTSPAADWTRDGSAVAHGVSYTLTAGDLGHLISGPSIPGVFVVEGAPLKKLVAPSLVGTGKIGSKLVLSPGVWTPALTSKSVAWKRDGKVVKGQTGTAYKVKSTDKGHKISATVTAKRAGFANGVATSAPVTGTLSAKVRHRALPGALTTPAPLAVSVADGLTVPVGTAVGCRSAYLVGQSPTVTAPTVVADVQIGRRLTCSSTVTVSQGTATIEAAYHAGPGAALAPYVKPFVAGV